MATEPPFISDEELPDGFHVTGPEADPIPTPASNRPEGYGRYRDDPSCVGCPRARSDMTPCAARDGATATADDGVCVGCGEHPADLLRDLVRAVTDA